MLHRSRAVAFATFAQRPNLSTDDTLVAAVLEQRGIAVQSCVWNDPEIEWAGFDGVVIRSCWDYHLRPAAFMAWVQHLDDKSIPVFNAPALIRWNHTKTYLQELETQGFPVVPTHWWEPEVSAPLPSLLADYGWERAVIKPTISATAHQTWVVQAQEAATHADRLYQAAQTTEMMIQPFISQIQTRGEWSLLFFGGTFSHAVLKRAKAGDFRVQDNFGGTYAAATSPAGSITIAQQVLASLSQETVYARIDGVETDHGFQIMEVELIEPSLFLSEDPAAPRRFADAIQAALVG